MGYMEKMMKCFFSILCCFTCIFCFSNEEKIIDPSTSKALEDLNSLLNHISVAPLSGSVFCNAAKEGNIDTVKMMIEQGIDINITNKQGDTALHWASRGDFFAIVTLLLEYKAEVNVKNNKSYAPLHWAVANGNVEIVELLLINGADPNVENVYETTPLSLASKNGYDSIIDLLIKFNANVVKN